MGPVFKRGFSLRAKLIGMAAAMVLLFGAAGAVGYFNLSRLMESAEMMNLYVQQTVISRGLADQDTVAAYVKNYDSAKQAYSLSKMLTFGTLLVALGVIGVFALYLARSVTGPLNRLIAGMQRVAEGDLTVQLEVSASQRDEIAQAAGALNVLVEELRQSIVQVRQAADVVYTGSQELTAATDQLSSSSQEQASSLEESAASMEEMTSTVKHNADNALQADGLAAESRDAAEEGVVMAQSIKRSMDLISTSSNKIADIIGVINDIAFQTNLLALNAAVEAARAGDHGRGFAVVAAEVRSLAQRSATAAKEIKTLIEDSQDKVGDGAHLVSISGSKLEGIVVKAKQVADLVSEISAASQEQASGIEQVNRAIVQMDTVTQSTAAQVEELSSTSQSLGSQAEHLKALVARFHLDEGAAQVTQPSSVASITTVNPSAAAANIAEANSRDAQVGNARPENVEFFKPRRTAAAKPRSRNDDWTEF